MDTPAALKLLTFALGDELCALDIRRVREIVQAGPMTAVPLMPAFVRGVVNLRGAVVPVIDLQARFGQAPCRIGKKSCIVIHETGSGGELAVIGLLVESVSEVVELADDSLEPPPAFGAATRQEFLQAVGRLRGRFVAVVDPGRAFDLGEMAALCDAACA